MTQLAVTTFWILVGLIVGQALMVARYSWALFRWKRRTVSDDVCPKVAAILCARGPDPFLAETVEALLDQDYPDYDIRVVVDCREDPAWEIVEQVVQRRRAGNVYMLPLTDRGGTCSLKIAGVLQGFHSLDESHQVVAMLDSDTVPHRTWLRELVSPLADERVGAASGNRCYMPDEKSWGSLVRYMWNAAAVVQMYWYWIGWGGSMTVRANVFRESDLPERLAHAFGEDSTICRALIRQRLKVAFVPSAMMVNRETCGIRGFFHFLIRQLLTVRLHNPWWWAVVGHGVLTSAAQMLAFGLLVWSLFAGSWVTAAWAGAGLALYLAAMVLMLAPMEVLVQRIVRARGETADWISPTTALRLVLAIPLTQAVYAVGLVSAMFARTHRWRGIVYRFGGGQKVRVVEDRPYEAAGISAESTTSI